LVRKLVDALELSLVDGEVVLVGDRFGFSMTPIAAAETARRLAALRQRPGGAWGPFRGSLIPARGTGFAEHKGAPRR
jgi:hypothetical protein